MTGEAVDATPVAETKADLQSEVTQGQAHLFEALDAARKQVNDRLTETRKNLQGSAE